MPDKGHKDKGGHEPRKKPQHTLKEKKALKREKEERKHVGPTLTAFHPRDKNHS